MRQRMHKVTIGALLFGAAALSCLPNPGGPVLDPPGTVLLYDANFNSIQMNGDFSGISWDPADTRNDLSLVNDNSWAITVSLLEADLSDGSLEFKFTHDYAWAPDAFGDGGSLGQAELSSGAGNIVLPVNLEQGFYTFTFDDETFRYSTEPEAAAGTLVGSLSFDGDTPPEGAEIALIAEHATGNTTLWSLEAVDGDFAFASLADSVYSLRASASGYASQTLSGIRVTEGSGPDQDFLLSQVFGAISGTVGFADLAEAPYPGAIVTALERVSQIEAGRDTSDVDSGSYLIESLSPGDFDLSFSAPGYSVGRIDSVHIAGDGEVASMDIILEPTPAASPDLPWFTAVVDGSLDAGWAADLTDPAGDSDWGATNDFTGLHIAWNAERIYVAVTGSFDGGGNTVNIYVDKDFGAGTGVVDFSTINGTSSADHLRKTVDMSAVAGFGADFAGSVWSLQYDPNVSALAPDGTASDLPGGLLVATSSVIEFSASWIDLYPELGGGVPPLSELAFICVIGGGGDQYLAGDTLPAVSDVTSPDAVFVKTLDGDEN
jgi:hypothetical protein